MPHDSRSGSGAIIGMRPSTSAGATSTTSKFSKKAIADQLAAEYGLPFHDLLDQSDILYLVDGFDEMSSHQEGYVVECFNRLARVVQRGCSVVIAMRSTVITSGLRLAWKNRDALAVQVHEFDDHDVDAWAEKWQAQTGADVTGDRLRSLSSQDKSVANNPLLLYMLAKFVDPVARAKQGLTRTEVFRIFVDETIRGKLRSSREEFPFQVPERDYRFLLQEMAWLASWPKHAPKCPARVVRERIPEQFLKDLSFQDIRTAFVLHFFEPGDLAGNEFEFQPAGFRQYLLAEWCVRTQLDAVLDERRPTHPLSRTRDQAIDALAQLPLKEEERNLLNELYEELGRLAREAQSALALQLGALGVPTNSRQPGSDLIYRLYERVRDEAEQTPERAWGDEKVGIPAGQEIPPGLDPLRRLFNYWDQCMMATVALFRGLGKDAREEKVFDRNPGAMGRFYQALYVVRGIASTPPLDLSRISLAGGDLRGVFLFSAKLTSSDLVQVRLIAAFLRFANLSGARLNGAYLGMADLTGARLNGADLTTASLFWANLTNADLTEANLTKADLTEANLTEANLTKANLTEANLAKANLSGANLSGATITEEQLKSTHGRPHRLPDGSEPSDERSPLPYPPRFPGEGAPALPLESEPTADKQVSPSPGDGVLGGPGEGAGG